MTKLSKIAAGAALALTLGAPVAAMADTAFLQVNGNMNPFTAGQAAGFACCGGDVTPAEAAGLAPVAINGGDLVTFAAVGVTDGAGTGQTGPDGAGLFNMADYGTGVAGADNIPVLALVGVFLDNSTPTGATQPGRLDFGPIGLNFTGLTPGLRQIFFIGDGLNAANDIQIFTAPTGATRLFLGTVDGFEWNNNTGDYRVTINTAPGGSVPEPATWALMIAGFGGAGAALRRRRTAVAA